MTTRRAGIAPLLLALGVGLLTAAQPALAARKQKIVGRVSGLPAKMPAVVVAVDPNTLTVLAAARVKGKGRYTLPASSGVTMLFADVEGDVPLFAASRAFRPAGRRTRADLTLAPTLAPAVASVRPRGAVESTPAVTVDWTMTGSLDGRPTRIGYVVESDLVRFGTRRCDLEVVTSDPDRRRAVEDEVARQQTEAFDPSTTIAFDPVQPDVRVQGRGTEAGGRHTVTFQAVEIATGTIIAESSQSGVDPFGTIDRAARRMAHGLCDIFHGPPAGPGGRGDPYFVVVRGTHSAQFTYRTPDSEDPMCNARDEADGTQMFMFESEPVVANVVTADGFTTVAIQPAAVLFTGTRTASYRFIRDGPACFPVTPVDTSGCGAPQDPNGLVDFVFSQSQIKTTIGFPDYANCPFTPLIDANGATGETAFKANQLDVTGATSFTFQDMQEEDEGNASAGYVNQGAAVTNWTVTFTPAE